MCATWACCGTVVRMLKNEKQKSSGHLMHIFQNEARLKLVANHKSVWILCFCLMSPYPQQRTQRGTNHMIATVLFFVDLSFACTGIFISVVLLTCETRNSSGQLLFLRIFVIVRQRALYRETTSGYVEAV